VLTSSASIKASRAELLDAVSHEFFHSWNVERIRPRSLEPFNLDEANMSGELWLAEGFTNYYGPLVKKRAGLTTLKGFLKDMGGAIDAVLTSPGRTLRSAVEMSQLAPFVDRASSGDRTNFDNTFISYYTWGSVIAIGLDLTLRERSDGRVSLDDFMRGLWDQYGKPGTRLPGYVETPYTLDNVKTVLATVSGDAAFANDFFARYIEGREVVDFQKLVARAGLEREDVIVSLGGTRVTTAAELERAIATRRPGDPLPIVYERRGERVTSAMTLVEDPHRELVAVEDAGQTLTDVQRRFRDRWLSGGF
jgi:predicted metalloprotease with PDZ domain